MNTNCDEHIKDLHGFPSFKTVLDFRSCRIMSCLFPLKQSNTVSVRASRQRPRYKWIPCAVICTWCICHIRNVLTCLNLSAQLFASETDPQLCRVLKCVCCVMVSVSQMAVRVSPCWRRLRTASRCHLPPSSQVPAVGEASHEHVAVPVILREKVGVSAPNMKNATFTLPSQLVQL